MEGRKSRYEPRKIFKKNIYLQSNCERNDYLPAHMINSENIPKKVAAISKDPLLRIDEMEKNIKFLKEEQKRMLCSLHKEIASLQAKNRGNLKKTEISTYLFEF